LQKAGMHDRRFTPRSTLVAEEGDGGHEQDRRRVERMLMPERGFRGQHESHHGVLGAALSDE
jgi:hypothetical protein